MSLDPSRWPNQKTRHAHRGNCVQYVHNGVISDKNSRNERSYEQHVYHRIQVFVTDLPFLETIGAEEASVTEGQTEGTRHFEIAGCIDIVL